MLHFLFQCCVCSVISTSLLLITLVEYGVNHNFNVLPNHCVAFCGQYDCITNEIAQRPNHRIYRIDTVVTPDHTDLTKLELDLIKKGKKLCPYYNSRNVKNAVPVCKTSKCHQNNKYTTIQAKYYKLKIISPVSSYQKQALIETEVIEYARGMPSSRMENSYFSYSENFMMSSTIYHIDCSNSPEKTAEWSHLNLKLIDEICSMRSDNIAKLLSPGISEYYLQPPYGDNNYSNPWTLQISFQESLENVDNCGFLAFISHLTGICNMRSVDFFHQVFIDKTFQCPILKAVSYLDSKTMKNRSVFELGFQKFDIPNIIYYVNVSSNRTLLYKWEPNSNIKNNNYTNFRETLKLLQYVDSKYSWVMAAAKCKEYNMTLPHFESERSTKKFVSYILNEFTLPTYSLFIALIYKV